MCFVDVIYNSEARIFLLHNTPLILCSTEGKLRETVTSRREEPHKTRDCVGGLPTTKTLYATYRHELFDQCLLSIVFPSCR